MEEIRCIGCGKLLGKVPVGTNAEIEIRCPKCKEIHTYRIGKRNRIMNELNIVKIVDGPLHPYLKDIEIIGRVQSDREQFYVFGCKKDDEKRFYKGILAYDRATGILGLNTVEEVEEFWVNGCDGMFLAVEKSDYEVIE